MNGPPAESPPYIKPVSVEDLEAAQMEGRVDAGTEQLLAAESRYVEAWRRKHGRSANDPDRLTGLAISGGGIRSAIFGLGVLQALAKRDLLRKIDYLSTVSGGGYIGSALTWLLSKQATATALDGDPAFGVGPENFPYGTDDPNVEPTQREDNRKQRALFKYLRSHGKYLTPGKGISVFSLAAVVVRAMFLNLLVWVPLLIAVILTLLALSSLGPDWLVNLPDPEACPQPVCPQEAIRVPLLFWLLLIVSAAVVAMFLLLCVGYSLGTWLSRRRKFAKRYKLRRIFERVAGTTVVLAGATFLLGSVPMAHGYVQNWALAAGSGSVAAGIAAALWTFVKSGRKAQGRVPLPVIASMGAFLLLYGILLTAFDVAQRAAEPLQNTTIVGVSENWLVGMVVIVLVILAVVTGRFVNLNYISVHRYYRDRLMETFLPDLATAFAGRTGPAHGSDNAHLSAFADSTDPRGPYPLINANVVLVDEADRTRRVRGGDSFLLSPYYSGSNATGWRRTDEFLDDAMTLPTAMAISGAAAEPNAGVGGVGITRNRLVSLLMSLLNLRLGYWALNPRRPKQTGPKPNHFYPGLYEIQPKGYSAHRRFSEISDGGHFENLGLYELIRRRLKLIIVFDAGADSNFAFGDLQTAIRRVAADFGARITFQGENALQHMIPSKPAGYPQDVELADRGHAVGVITYANGSEGRLIYVKTTMVRGLSLDVLGYRGSHPSFPDESTADQFFDENQVEAYRKLGYTIGMQMIDPDGLAEFARVTSP